MSHGGLCDGLLLKRIAFELGLSKLDSIEFRSIK
jgi:hypothetical protein